MGLEYLSVSPGLCFKGECVDVLSVQVASALPNAIVSHLPLCGWVFDESSFFTVVVSFFFPNSRFAEESIPWYVLDHSWQNKC